MVEPNDLPPPLPSSGPLLQAQPPHPVVLAGAGPGDPELLTLRAWRRMQQCDLLMYDNLVSAEVLACVPAGVERLYVGKKNRASRVPQHVINGLLVQHAQAGRRVLRLKGGDPYIFGRGGEEAEALVAAGLPFEVIPGITSAGATACLYGLPLTHRDWAQSVAFVTGHRRDGESLLPWIANTHPQQTLVVYMGVRQAGAIAQALIEHGRDPATPVAIVERATQPQCRIFIDELARLNERVCAEAVQPPALFIVGDVVRLYATLGAGAVIQGRDLP